MFRLPQRWTAKCLRHLTKLESERDTREGVSTLTYPAFNTNSSSVPYACWRRLAASAVVPGGICRENLC